MIRNHRRGLVYLNNRYHDPTLGAFISVDPLVVKTGEAYIYGAASPIIFSDPSGRIYDNPDNSYSKEVFEYALKVHEWRKKGYEVDTTTFSSYSDGWGYASTISYSGRVVAIEWVRDFAVLSEGFLNPVAGTRLRGDDGCRDDPLG